MEATTYQGHDGNQYSAVDGTQLDASVAAAAPPSNPEKIVTGWKALLIGIITSWPIAALFLLLGWKFALAAIIVIWAIRGKVRID